MPRKDAGGGPISAQAQQDLVSEGIENFELPKSIVTKIAKSAIPDNVKLQKETVLSLVKGSTVFINYLAATAHDVALSKQHKSISASDVLKALEMIEFGDLVDPLQNELQAYRDNAKGDKNRKGGIDRSNSVNKGKAKEGDSASSASRPKGKAKAPLPPLFSTVPREAVASSMSHDMSEDVEMAQQEQPGENEEGGEEDYNQEYGEEFEEQLPDAYETDEELDSGQYGDEAEESRRDAARLDDADVHPGEDSQM